MSAVTGRALRALKGARFRVFGVALRAGLRWGFLLLGAVSESTVDRLRAFSETAIRTPNRLDRRLEAATVCPTNVACNSEESTCR